MNPETALPEDPDRIMRDWYEKHYNHLTASADGSFFATYMHRAMERRFPEQATFARVLEVGGNRGEHVPYVRHGYDEYLLTDLHQPTPMPELAVNPRIRTQACDVEALPYPDSSFDRVISTCLLHHVSSPLRAVREMRRVVRPGGAMTVLVPNDPGVAHRVGKTLTSGRAARAQGLADEHKLLAAIDHRNHFRSIRCQLEHALRSDNVSLDWMPWRVPSVEFNAFTVFHATRSVRRR